MVQQLQRGPSLADYFTRGLEDSVIPALQQQYQRGQLQNALNQVRNVATNPNSSPLDTTLSTLHALAGIPGSEKYTAQVLPMVLQQAQLARAAALPSPQQMGGNASQAQQQVTPSNIPSNAPQQLQTLPDWLPAPSGMPFKGSLEPTALGLGPLPNIYTPEQIKTAEQDAAAHGQDPTMISQMMENYNKRSREQIQDIVGAAKTQSDIAQLRAQRQQDFRNVLSTQLGPNVSADDFAVAERMSQSPSMLKISNDVERANQTKKMFNQYQNAKNNFITEAERNNWDEAAYERQNRSLAQSGKVLVKNGQRDLAERILKEGGRGPVEVEKVLSPLSKEISTQISKLPKPIEILEHVTALPETDAFDKQVTKAQQTRANQLKKYEDLLERSFKAGSIDPTTNEIIPGTSLLLLREDMMKNGVTWQEFNDMINRLLADGKIDLDQKQQAEKPLLGQHPMQNLGLREILFRAIPFYVPRQ